MHRDRFEQVYLSTKGNTTISLDLPAFTQVLRDVHHITSPKRTQRSERNIATEPPSDRPSTLLGAPEEAYVRDMIRRNTLPFLWRDSAFVNNRWAKFTREEWHTALIKYVQLAMCC